MKLLKKEKYIADVTMFGLETPVIETMVVPSGLLRKMFITVLAAVLTLIIVII